MGFLYIKHSMWLRYKIDDSLIDRFLKSSDKYSNIYDLSSDHDEVEWQYDSSEFITPEKNDDIPTINLFDHDGRLLWCNEDPNVAREKKLNQLIDEREEHG